MFSGPTVLIIALLLAVAQLGAGVVVGLWLARRRAEGASTDKAEARRLAADLRRITGAVTHSVRQHHEQLRHADRRLQDVQHTHGDTCPSPTHQGLPLTDLVAGVVREMLAANQRLSRELDDAHRQLHQQAATQPGAGAPQQSLADTVEGLAPNEAELIDGLDDVCRDVRASLQRLSEQPASV
ncbi:hypothetical protein Pla175_02430 [Pirellulimonas nuda]|uniref:Uncharacterized protein n=1 Tax=Pirellulimonas nuda TaxID=2528009 RepID=A0A518D5Z9_9BACT|nr:hypothetical protein [Pirellulimonas nuda]QDU86889.1 hypothetical protein Pla175_02430 [Pirellulimonas nuda]